MTFEEKFRKFKLERVGFFVKSEEVAKELAKTFAKEGMKGRDGRSPDDVLHDCLVYSDRYRVDYYVAYNYHKNERKLSFGTIDSYALELLDVTLEEIKEYNG